MRSHDLISLFDALVPPSGAPPGRMMFSACKVPGYERHRLAKGRFGTPVLLIDVADSPGEAVPSPFSLEHLAIQHELPCLVTHSDGTHETGTFSMVECTGSDATLYKYFLELLDGILGIIGTLPSRNDVARAMNRLVELFRLMAQPSKRAVQGLWAELLVLVSASEPLLALQAWRSDRMDPYDFSSGDQRLEVKSAGGRRRRHHFSLGQLTPPLGTTAIVASVLVQAAGGGASVQDLTAEIRGRVGDRPDLIAKLDLVVASGLGESWRASLVTRFDRELALAELRFFDTAAIPSIDPCLPPGVSDVHFSSDLDEAPETTGEDLREAGGLFAAVVPVK